MTDASMLIIDIDGTLLDSAMVLHQSARDALNCARDAGFELVFATGRQYRSCQALIKDIAPNAPAILHSGSLIKNTATDETLFARPVDADTARDLAAMITSAGFPPVIMMDGYTRGFDFLTTDPVGRTQTHARFVNKNRAYGIFVDEVPTELPAPVTQVLALGAEEELGGVHSAAMDRFENLVDMRIIRAPQYSLHVFEAYAKGISKWDAVHELCRASDIGPGHIAAIGDDINDLEMLLESDFGVAMGNAPEHVKRAADATVASCDEEGFADAVELILAQSPPRQ